MDFKLLAVRPIDGCGGKFLKILEINRLYKFYNNFEFFSNGQIIDSFSENVPVYSIVDNIEESNNLGNDFFLKNVNVTCLVGKNGSGKSTLVTLIIGAINQLSVHLQREKNLKTTANLKQIGGFDKSEKIAVELFYKIDVNYFVLKVEDYKVKIFNLSSKVNFNFEHFFYTNVVNYSIYAFNSWDLGDWIDELFHKNDSYQIPVVLNPKRENKHNRMAGIIDINNENFLLQQRLLSVIIYNPNYEISSGLKIDNIILDKKLIKNFSIYSNNSFQTGKSYRTDKDKYKEFEKILQFNYAINFENESTSEPGGSYQDLNLLLKNLKIKFRIDHIIIPKYQVDLDIYILYKIINICEKYIDYSDFIKVEDPKAKYKKYTIDSDLFLKKIYKTHSHIVLKLRQVINFIKFYNILWKKYIYRKSNLKINISRLRNELLHISLKNNIPLIELLPPPIFEYKFFNSEQINILESISSGEMQLIHSTSSIIYHLNNLNSVDQTKNVEKYNYVNIILDEIELYFHPEFQRKYLKKLLDDIKSSNVSEIYGINILIISHSPFILSDIPKQNVLFLGKGNSEKGKPIEFGADNTFAENIHEILANGFFLEETMGAFAKSKIDSFLEYYFDIKKKYESSDWGNLLRIEQEKFLNRRAIFTQLINLIGENFIREILKNHLLELERMLVPEISKAEILQQINKLQLDLKRLNNE